MWARRSFAALAASGLLAAAALPAAAQYAPNESCIDLYNRTMAIYQASGPQSPQYADMLAYYSSRCASGTSVAPAYPYYDYAPDAGAAVMGGIIGGAVLGGAIGGYYGHSYGGHHTGYHGNYHGGYRGGFHSGGTYAGRAHTGGVHAGGIHAGGGHAGGGHGGRHR